MNGRIVFAVFITLLLIAGVLGVGYYGYTLGVMQGAVDTGRPVAPATGAMPYPYFYPPFGWHMFGGFGLLLSCFVPLIILSMIFTTMRMIFWRGRWGMHRRHWDKGEIPPMVAEWHRKMHEQPQQPVTDK